MITVESLVDKHKGKLGFVVGAGPSLHKVRTDLLRDYVTITVNSAVSKVRDCDYFLADDIGVKHWNYYQDILPKCPGVSLLYKGKLRDDAAHLDPERICWFGHKSWYVPSTKTYIPEGLVYTKSEPIVGARTAAGSAVHFAYLMGCDPIVLLGCDCCYEGMNRYFWQFDGEEKCYRLNGEKVFSFPNAGIRNGKPLDSHSRDFLEYWEAVAKQAQQQGINILSASGGLLDAFPRMTLEEVLEKYGERKRN
jgi:hypothetical protein